MTIEEKAKAYDEALAKAKEIYNDSFFNEGVSGHNLMERLFPELAESEDERIRKAIIDTLKDYHHFGSTNGVLKENMIAWLEKQGEQKDINPTILEKEKMDNAFTNMMLKGKTALEAIHEEKVDNANKVEPKFKVGDKLVSTKNPHLTYEILNVGNVNELGNLEYEVEIFTDGKPGIQVGDAFKEHNIHLMECVKVDEWAKLIDEAKPKWTGEDDYNLQCCIAKAERDIADGNLGRNKELIDWLKQIKQRMEEQQ